MRIERPDRIEMIDLAEIEVGERIRALSEPAVAAILQSVAEIGQITSPIHVRKVKSGFRLIDGLHRREVASRLGFHTIAARVWTCTAEEARLMEGDANLATAHLAPLDLALSLADRKRAYLRLHPETAHGLAGANARWAQDASDKMSFASWMASLFGCSRRQVERILAAGEALEPDEVAALRSAPRRVAMSDLTEIAKIALPEERSFAVRRLARGEARTIKAGRALFRPAPDATPAQGSIEASFKALLDAWGRASKPARRRFFEARWDQVEDLYLEMAEAQDAAAPDLAAELMATIREGAPE